jgi:F0F1-type ATP synthase membrane subunit c/vacuolar-type H+-ATPase subunit K
VTGNTEETRSRVAAAHRTALTLVLAFAMSIVIYAGVGVIVLIFSPRTMRGTNMRAELPYPFYAAAAILAIGSIIIRRARLHRMKLEVVAGTRGVEGLVKHLLNTTILVAAIAEVIGVLALVVAFFGGDGGDIIRLGIVAMAVSLYNYPRRSSWQRVVDYFSATNAGASKTSLGL